MIWVYETIGKVQRSPTTACALQLFRKQVELEYSIREVQCECDSDIPHFLAYQ
jgi:hypothetical protein